MSDNSINTTGNKFVKTNISFDVETGSEVIKKSLPFRIGILLDTATSQEKSVIDQPWLELKPGIDVEVLLRKLPISDLSRGDLSNFIGNVINIPMLEVKVISRSKADFANNLTGKTEECELYKSLDKIVTGTYEEGLSLLLSDYYFSENADDAFLLQQLSAVAEALQVPFIAATNDSRSRTVLPFVRLQASENIETYHNPVFQLAEHIADHFDRYAWPVESEEAEIFSYQLIACRFAQYLKTIMRDKVGSFLTGENVQAFLNKWIAQYVLLDDQATPEIQAAYPLKSARIDIMDIPGEPGSYQGILYIQPQFLLGAPPSPLRLLLKLPG